MTYILSIIHNPADYWIVSINYFQVEIKFMYSNWQYFIIQLLFITTSHLLLVLKHLLLQRKVQFYTSRLLQQRNFPFMFERGFSRESCHSTGVMSLSWKCFKQLNYRQESDALWRFNGTQAFICGIFFL